MHMKTRRKKMVLKLDALKVETLVMPAATPIRAVTTSHTCPTRCDTEFECSNADCPDSMMNVCTKYCTGDC